MPRIVISLFALSVAFLAPEFASAGACKDRILGFNIAEDYDDHMKPVPLFSSFPIEEYSPDSAFQGVIVKVADGSKAKLEIEVYGADKSSLATHEFKLEKTDHKKGYYLAAGLNPESLFDNGERYFALRIVKQGEKAEPICESGPFPVHSGD